MGRGSVYRYQHTRFSSNGRFRGGHISEDFHYIEKADVAEELNEEFEPFARDFIPQGPEPGQASER